MTSVLIVEDEESLADPLAFLLRKEGFEATVVGDGPAALAEELATAKATSLAKRFPLAAIIGCDQVAVCEGTRLGKPGSAERAVDQLRQLSGRPHELVTAVCVWHAGKLQQHTDHTRLTMRSLRPANV